MVPPSVHDWTYPQRGHLHSEEFKEIAVMGEVEGYVKPNTFFNTA